MKKLTIAACTTMLFVTASAQAPRGPRVQPDAAMTLYAPNQHELYDGHFVIRGTRIYQAGKLNDASPWDHMGDDAKNLRAVDGDPRPSSSISTFAVRSATRPIIRTGKCSITSSRWR
jgi:hypothetical protein